MCGATVRRFMVVMGNKAGNKRSNCAKCACVLIFAVTIEYFDKMRYNGNNSVKLILQYMFRLIPGDGINIS